MDTNLVLPLGPRKCKVVFDYFIEASLKVMHFYLLIQCGLSVSHRCLSWFFLWFVGWGGRGCSMGSCFFFFPLIAVLS